MRTQSEKGLAFRALHQRKQAFVVPNPWDVGTARLLESLRFEALASTSAGFAFSLGRQDGALSRDETIAHLSSLSAATDLPLSGDLENGFGHAPESVRETIKLAADAGVVGGSIEDATGDSGDPIYERSLAMERIQAAAETVRGLPFVFTLTARAENFLHRRPDIRDTILRLQAYQEAGADVLFAPGLASEEDISAVVRSVDRPVNVVMGLQGVNLSVRTLSDIGVKRISLGSTLSRVALGAFLRAAREISEHGTFAFAGEAVSYQDIISMFSDRGEGGGRS